jgi:hypothetical protein
MRHIVTNALTVPKKNAPKQYLVVYPIPGTSVITKRKIVGRDQARVFKAMLVRKGFKPCILGADGAVVR